MLNLTYDELMAQPADWVNKRMLIKLQKSKAEEWQIKKQQGSQKAKS